MISKGTGANGSCIGEGGNPPRERPEEKPPPRRACALARVPQPGPPSRLASWLRLARLRRRPTRAAILGAAAARVRETSFAPVKPVRKQKPKQARNKPRPSSFVSSLSFPLQFQRFFFLISRRLSLCVRLSGESAASLAFI